ncbi:MAG TPA: hypothetical protein VIF39_12105 [Hyphomicrobium sp.]|jgi:hypothetical protein
MTIFFRILADDDKSAILKAGAFDKNLHRFECDPHMFARIDGSPFIYWVGEKIIDLMANLPSFESEDRTTKCGLGTLDDFRFLRLAWETPQGGERWENFTKGGSRSPWVSDVHLKLNWASDGNELKRFVEKKVGSASRKIQAQDYYFKMGLTFPRRPLNCGWFSAIPSGVIFADNGPMVFAPASELLSWLAFFNASVPHFLMQLMMARGQEGSAATLTYEVGMVARCPVPTHVFPEILSDLAKKAWSAKLFDENVKETSPYFILPQCLLAAKLGKNERAKRDISGIEQQIDDIVFGLYSLTEEDRARVDRWARQKKNNQVLVPVDDTDDDDTGGALGSAADQLISWAVGVTFGRFDICLANGEHSLPKEPEPFDPLPQRSLGMRDPNDVVFFVGGIKQNQAPRIMVDDRELDVYGGIGDVAWRAIDDVRKHVDLPEFSGLTRNDVRSWIAKEFFPFHIKMYSKSRRRAPIYWQLTTPSARFSIWLYIHGFTIDTLFRVQKIVDDKTKIEQKALEQLRSEFGAQPTGAQRKAIEAQENFVGELQTMFDEVRRVASLWNPNLDDGAVINAAPLWRLFPQHKPWQKECKATWDELCKGDYDWSHLAMHLWPERVVPKCATDCSLAIAHGLEDVFWFEDDDGKWKPLDNPARPVDSIVAERTSPAVKAALKSILEAPDTTATVKRSRKAKTA